MGLPPFKSFAHTKHMQESWPPKVKILGTQVQNKNIPGPVICVQAETCTAQGGPATSAETEQNNARSNFTQNHHTPNAHKHSGSNRPTVTTSLKRTEKRRITDERAPSRALSRLSVENMSIHDKKHDGARSDVSN